MQVTSYWLCPSLKFDRRHSVVGPKHFRCYLYEEVGTRIFLILFNVFFCLLIENAWSDEAVLGVTEQNTQSVSVDPSAAVRGEWCIDSRPRSFPSIRKLTIGSGNKVQRESTDGAMTTQNFEYSPEKKILIVRTAPESTPRDCPLPRTKKTDPVVLVPCPSGKELVSVYELQDDGRLQKKGLIIYSPNWQQLPTDEILRKKHTTSEDQKTDYYYKRCSPLTS